MFFLRYLERHTPTSRRLGTYLDCLGSEMSKALRGFRARSSFPKPSNFAVDAQNSILLWGEMRRQWAEEKEESLGDHRRPSGISFSISPLALCLVDTD